MRFRNNGGVIGTTVTTNSNGAIGMWSMSEYTQKLLSSAWPVDNTNSLLADPFFDYNSILLKAVGSNSQQNYTFLDSSTNNLTVTRNGDITQGAFSPFSFSDGYWGAYFDGNADSLNTTLDSLNIRTAFCIEAFAFTASRSGYILFSASTTSSTGSNFYLNEYLGTVYLGDGVTNNLSFAATEIPLNAWYHIAVTFDGTTYRVFINGNLVGSSTSLLSNFNIIRIDIGIRTVGGTNYYNGYLSNFRVVKGSAVYTSTFTPSTAPLSAISGTSLLTCQSNRFKDNSTNNYTITRNGDTKVVAFGPFNPDSGYSASITGGSAYFDGTGDYLTAGSSVVLSSDFTVECWVYGVSYGSNGFYLYGLGNDANSSGATFFINASGYLRVFSNNTNKISSTSVTFNLNTWNHVAYVRSSGTLKVYLNGSQVDTVSGWSDSISGLSHINAELNGVGPTTYPGGTCYISNLRVATSAIYTTSFTPSTTPLTNVSGTSLLLSGTNAGIIDASRKTNVYTVGNAQVSTSVFKFDKSMYFDGTGDYITVLADPLFSFGTGNFTVEFWIRFNSVSSVQTIYDNNYGTASNLLFQTNTSGNMIVYLNGTLTTITSSVQAFVNNWYHYALVRSGSTVTLYLNGSSVGSTTYSGNAGNASSPVYIGGSTNGGGYYLNGYLEDVRVTRGYARYSSNFTPPTLSFNTR